MKRTPVFFTKLPDVTRLAMPFVRCVLTVDNLGIGGDMIFYQVPERLFRTHGESPKTFHVFFRLRIPANMGRMWDHVMLRPMGQVH